MFLFPYLNIQFNSAQSLSRVQLFATPWTAAHQASPSITKFTQTHVHRVSDAIQTSHPLSSPSPLPPIPPSIRVFSNEWVSSASGGQSTTWVSDEFQLQHQSFQWTPRTDLIQDGLVGSPCSPRDSQESSPTPQFKSINSSVLNLLYSPTLTSIHDHWVNHSLD